MLSVIDTIQPSVLSFDPLRDANPLCSVSVTNARVTNAHVTGWCPSSGFHGCKSLLGLVFPVTQSAVLCLFRSVAWSSLYRHMCQSPQYGCCYTIFHSSKLQSSGTVCLFVHFLTHSAAMSQRWVTALYGSTIYLLDQGFGQQALRHINSFNFFKTSVFLGVEVGVGLMPYRVSFQTWKYGLSTDWHSSPSSTLSLSSSYSSSSSSPSLPSSLWSSSSKSVALLVRFSDENDANQWRHWLQL